MNQLELKHIQHYPIGGDNALKVSVITDIFDDEREIHGSLSGIISRSFCDFVEIATPTFHRFPISQIKPILRPMSDLYKEIDGKIGIHELSKIGSGDDHPRLFKYKRENDRRPYNGGRDYYGKLHFLIPNGRVDVSFSEAYNDLSLFFNSNERDEFSHELCVDQSKIYKYLLEHHYDVHGLIGTLAIDVNTIK